MKTYVFKAELQLEEDGRWSSWIEALPGCAAWGNSEREALDALKDAADIFLEDIVAAGEEILSDDVEVIEAPVVAIAR